MKDRSIDTPDAQKCRAKLIMVSIQKKLSKIRKELRYAVAKEMYNERLGTECYLK